MLLWEADRATEAVTYGGEFYSKWDGSVEKFASCDQNAYEIPRRGVKAANEAEFPG
jgi:hypothetical protein